ncbi:low-affinity inorganic phosphate transporter [Silvimonas terrae]|uniref:Phosphate transporter n=1 Tax=Silvimonas terrae TaxID=300266 RepID=A0A840RCD9_9NEIS|nr:inorganic phosphate transporter [Silvimonas terrae]MBB5190020.1 low-affinity inorganic phosphate transporter [Silvimonas terrae]
MPDLFSGIPLHVAVSLTLALLFVLFFEFINGFHDTANAVATVIYTKSMPPHLAVVLSGIFNFAGVLLGGLGVAYAIVHLLPVDLLINVSTSHGLIMVFALLASAILWNFGTWYLGLPASSSHTLIGSILGVGLTNAWLTHTSVKDGINWGKAVEIGMSLIISPIVGVVLAGTLLLVLKKLRPDSGMHKTPEQRKGVDGKKHPPFWTRLVLILSALGVSFAHGSNDGQKGIGLIMLVLIGIVPAKFVVDLDATAYQIERTRDATIHLRQFYQRNAAAANEQQVKLSDYLALGKAPTSDLPARYKCDPALTEPMIADLLSTLDGVQSYRDITPDARNRVRRSLLCLDDTAKKVGSMKSISSGEKADLSRLRKDLTATTEYSPYWVILAVALALGVGTMIGWRRVVQTVGEKIGKQGMTYAQGLSAQITAAVSIGIANIFGLPVSTTHVLSSGVAGTMLANRSGLQGATIRNILLAWVLTLPAAMALAAGMFWLASRFIQ